MKNKLIESNSDHILTDGGLETTLIFHYGIDLNHFAAFELLKNEDGKQALKSYYNPYLDVAKKYNSTFLLDTPTWRANQDWADKLGISKNELRYLNIESVNFIKQLVKAHSIKNNSVIINGVIGPRGDGYIAENCMTAKEAVNYHSSQIGAFSHSNVDMITAVTMNYIDEALGIALAAKHFGLHVAISFTVETNGKLPNGENLKDSIEKIDTLTQNYVSHYMINCAHPEHFNHVLKKDGNWKNRIKGIRANASTKSHAELDECEILDVGDKHLLATNYMKLKELLPNLKIIGGCCGTDHSHIEYIYSQLKFNLLIKAS